MNPELFKNTVGSISPFDCVLNGSDRVISMDWHLLNAEINNKFSRIDNIWFHRRTKKKIGALVVGGDDGGPVLLPIAIRGKSSASQYGTLDYVLVSPPISVYGNLFTSSRDVNPRLASIIEKTIRYRARILNAEMGIADLHREWFVKTVINNIDQGESTYGW